MKEENTSDSIAKNNDKYILHSVENALSIMDLFFAYEELSPSDVTVIWESIEARLFVFSLL